uniref:Collagen, type XV, alpha 1b n=1 Tax=Neolamprologus brichardi TaxID=32507 RepID=A0A3Q4G6P0_NEOBR
MGPTGSPGQPGPPGFGRPGPQGPPGPPGYKTTHALTQEAHHAAEGTVAYVSERGGELYIRARNGWHKIQVCRTRPERFNILYKIIADTQPGPNPNLHLVALNAPLRGDMRGIRGADFQCYQQARAVGLTSTYRAFLSSHLQDLATIVRKADRNDMPVVNLRNVSLECPKNQSPLINSLVTFSHHIRVYSISVRGQHLSPFSHRPEKLVWHGSSTTGIRLTTNYCEAWRTADMAVTGQVALLQTGRLLGQHVRSCSNHYVVLCIENTYVGNMHQRRN